MAVGILYFLHTLWLVVRRARAADLASCVHVLAQASHRWKARHHTLSRLFLYAFSFIALASRPPTLLCTCYTPSTYCMPCTCPMFHVYAIPSLQLLIILLVVPPLVHVKILGPCEQCYSFSGVAVHAAGIVLVPSPSLTAPYHPLPPLTTPTTP